MSQLLFWNKQNHNNNNNNNNSNNNNTNNNSSNGNNNNSSSNNGNNSDGANTNGTNGTNNASNGNSGGVTNGIEGGGNGSGKGGGKNRNWLHQPEALVSGHVVYLVKFFGHLPVEHPKGIDVVKDAIRKLQFAEQMRKAETGTQEKHKKLEITISVDGVAVQEPRTNRILHQFPLHNISYCADEKGVKKFFSFIAKSVKSNNNNNNNVTGGSGSDASTNGTATDAIETHECFVFISNKLASDITLTIGQAFDLAYRKYVSSAEKVDLGRAQQQIVQLERTNTLYKERLLAMAQHIPASELDALLFQWSIKNIIEVPVAAAEANNKTNGALTNGNGAGGHDEKLLIDTNSSNAVTAANSNHSSPSKSSFVPPLVPPRSISNSQRKMEELLLNSDSDSDFDPRADETPASMDSGGSGSGNGNGNGNSDLFGFEPSALSAATPTKTYGQQLFYNNNDIKLQNNNNSSSTTMNSFTNELNVAPLLAPPPKVATPRRNTSVANNNNNNNSNSNSQVMTNGNTDLFGSDPFEINGPSIFKTSNNVISVDDFSLESLDPLRK